MEGLIHFALWFGTGWALVPLARYWGKISIMKELEDDVKTLNETEKRTYLKTIYSEAKGKWYNIVIPTRSAVGSLVKKYGINLV